MSLDRSVGTAQGQKTTSTATPKALANDPLLRGFVAPPPAARLRCSWWWLNGYTTEATITRDLTEMKRKGYGGVLLVDANGANLNGNDNVPAGPEFGSPAWTELYVHALKVADQLGLEVALNITSGWNVGAPWVQPEQASKLLTFSRAIVSPGSGPGTKLPTPPTKNGFYREIAVLAYPLHRGTALPGKDSQRKPLDRLSLKSAATEGGFSMPDLSSLLIDATPDLADDDAALAEVQDISAHVDGDGTLHWSPPSNSAGSWEVLRVGYTSSDARVSTSSGAWQGLAIDYLDPKALDLYWQKTVLPLIEAAKPYKSLKYLASDSWELGGTNWTPAFRVEFRRRRGYDPVPYLPVVAGRILGSREISTRFLADLRRTVGDLVNEHYDTLASLTKSVGLAGIECESGGPHGAPFDALETFRSSAVPQTEYWAMSNEHRSADADRFFVKESASAAHIYGRPLVADEGMTSIGNQWNESLGLNLKPSFDRALTEGMNRLVWHEFTSSPPELGLPGKEYFAGTHLNPNVTWWRDAGAFIQYLNRAQFLLQQGLPVNDVLYYYGDMVPNFVRLKPDDPALSLPGFDYDVTSTDALLHRMKFASGDLHTPEDIHYKLLVLPRYRILPLSALELAKQYLDSGGVIAGLRPLRPQGIISAEATKQFEDIAVIWATCEQSAQHRIAVGKGQLFCTDNSRNVLQALNIAPDMQTAAARSLDYIHRRVPATGALPATHIYFLRNTQSTPLQTSVTLRVSGLEPELLDAVTGEVTASLLYIENANSTTTLPLSLEPYGSIFVIFRHSANNLKVTRLEHDGQILFDSTHAALPFGLSLTRKALITPDAGRYSITHADGRVEQIATCPEIAPLALTNPWTLTFPPNWGAPPSVELGHLQSWAEFADPGIRYFSGTASYHTTVTISAAQVACGGELWLDLGDVRELATVHINGAPVQTLWKQPWAVRADTLLHAGNNTLEIDVTNFWPNRLIGDAQSENGKHYTWTNIRKYSKDSPLLPSGLLGPVAIKPVYRLFRINDFYEPVSLK